MSIGNIFLSPNVPKFALKAKHFFSLVYRVLKEKKVLKEDVRASFNRDSSIECDSEYSE